MALGRRRYQRPSVFKTKGKRPEWFFRARKDAIDADKTGITLKGKRPEERFHIGYCDEMTKQEAKKKRDEVLAEVINKPHVLITSQVPFSAVLDAYRRDHLPNLRETTRATQEYILKSHMDALGKLRMCDIDTLAIQRWLSGMKLAYRTKAVYLSLLRTIWNKAQDWGFTQQAFPVRRKEAVTLGVRRDVKGRDMPSMDQIRRLLSLLEDPFRAMAEVALYSGLRISEIRGLKWQDIGPQSMTVRRRVSAAGGVDVTKNGKDRVFDVRPLAATFARVPRTSDWIFHHPGAGYEVCRKRIAAAAENAGISVSRFGWHHLRAAFNTLARDSGADSFDRQAIMGHSTEAMNAVYIHATEDDLRRRGDLMLQVQAKIIGEAKGVQ